MKELWNSWLHIVCLAFDRAQNAFNICYVGYQGESYFFFTLVQCELPLFHFSAASVIDSDPLVPHPTPPHPRLSSRVHILGLKSCENLQYLLLAWIQICSRKTCLQPVSQVKLSLNVCFCAWGCLCESVWQLVWAPTIRYLCLFLEGGDLETYLPRVIGWLAAVRSLLWRVLSARFFRFQLNVECSTLEGHLKCVMCLNVCMYLFVCLHTLLFHFHTQMSFCKDKATSWAGKMGPETHSVIFPCCPPCHLDSIRVSCCDLKRKQGGYKHNSNSKLFLAMSKSSLIWRGIALFVIVCVCVCVFPVSNKRLLAPC